MHENTQRREHSFLTKNVLHGILGYLLAGILLVVLSSCATKGMLPEASTPPVQTSVLAAPLPAWAERVYQQEDQRLLVTGGPAPSLDEARKLAYTEISYMVKTEIYSVTKDYVNVSNDAVDEYVSEQFSIATQSSTNSILNGITIEDTFHDSANGLWYVLAAISDENLERSRQETIKQMEELQAIFGTFRTYFADTILTLLTGAIPYTDQYRLATSALETLYSIPSYDSLIVSENLPRSVHVYSFLTDFLKGSSSSLSLQVSGGKERYKRGDMISVEFKANWAYPTELGLIPWVLKETKSGDVLIKFTTNGSKAVLLSFETRELSYGKHAYEIVLDRDELGIDFSRIPIAVSLPSTSMQFELALPPVGLVVQSRLEPPLDDDIAVGLWNVVGTKIDYPMVAGEQKAYIRIAVQDNQGTPGAYGIEFCHMGLRIEVLVNGAIIHSETIAPVKEAGIGYPLAARKAFRSLEQSLNNNTLLFARMNAALTQSIEAGNL